MKSIFSTLILICAASPVVHATVATPIWSLTPGTTCTASDPSFSGYDYPEHIARCNRTVNTAEKQKVAEEYGNIAKVDWPNYEFDHLIPLCAGGSDDIANIWPQPLDEAKLKDKVEDEVCLAMKAGTMTQAQAIQKIHDWFDSQYQVFARMAPEFSCASDPEDHGPAIDVHFALVDDLHLEGFAVRMVDPTTHTLTGAKTQTTIGKATHIHSGPLTDLNAFGLTAGAHHFSLYINKDASQALLKAESDRTFPNLKRLSCHLNQSGGS